MEFSAGSKPLGREDRLSQIVGKANQKTGSWGLRSKLVLSAPVLEEWSDYTKKGPEAGKGKGSEVEQTRRFNEQITPGRDHPSSHISSIPHEEQGAR